MFLITYDVAAETLSYVSPKTGLWYSYAWQPGTERWFCAASPHFVEELLVRDLIYYCKGYPDL